MWKLAILGILALQATVNADHETRRLRQKAQEDLLDSLLLNRVLQDQSLPPVPPPTPVPPVGPPPTPLVPTTPPPFGPPPTAPVGPVPTMPVPVPVPTIPLPTMPGPTMPIIPMPTIPMPTMPGPTMPIIPMPTIPMPTMPGPTMPIIPMPTIPMPTMPGPTMPIIPMPTIPMPTIPGPVPAPVVPPAAPISPVPPPVTMPTAPPQPVPTGPTPTAPQPTTGNTILDLINSTPDLSTLATAVAASPDVAEALATVSPLTMFAPGNAAMAALGAEYTTVLVTDPGLGLHLRSLLTNHATNEGAFTSSQLTNGQQLNMLSQLAPITVNITGTTVSLVTQATGFQLIGPTQVVGVDAMASNGVMHQVDQVLYPIWYFVNLIEGLTAQGGAYSTLLQLITAAGLENEIATSQVTTLLSPTNAAFAALPPDLVASLTAPENVDSLREVLLYHFIPVVVNPLVYQLNTDVLQVTMQGESVVIRVESDENSMALTYFNGVLSGSIIGLTKWSTWFELPEVLIPPNFVPPGPTAPTPTAPAPTPTAPVPTGPEPTLVTFPPIAGPTIPFPPIPEPTMPVLQPTAPQPTVPMPTGPLPTAPVPTGPPPTSPSATAGTILGLINSDPDLSSLAAAVAASQEVTQALSTLRPLTMFAPVNPAFEALGADYVNVLLTDTGFGLHLRNILTNHATNQGAYFSGDLTDGQLLSMLSGLTPIEVDVNGNDVSLISYPVTLGFMEPTQVIAVNSVASNGVMHKVNAVLQPVWAFVNLVEMLSTQQMFSTLLTLVSSVGLEEAIATSQSTTLLAPTNEAFTALGEQTIAFLTAPENADTLRDILLYHFLPSVINPLALPLNTDISRPTSQGEAITIRVQAGADGLADVFFNGAEAGPVIGLVKWSSWYVLDEVLLPPGVTIG